MNAFDDHLSAKLRQRLDEGLFRQLRHPAGLVDFCSNDYLGLARSQELFHSISKKISELPVQNGSTGSRLLSGNSPYHEHVEKLLTVVFRSEAALIFNSGYDANLAVLSSLPSKNDTVIYDEKAHASIKDGARLSLAKRFSFLHNDPSDLEKKIRRASGQAYVAIESIYSMDGDICPLEEILEITTRYGAHLVLDEAHSTGILGEDGSGYAVSKDLHEHIAVRIYTFGKAMGIHGACVTGSQALRDYLVNFARPFIYTTAPDNHTLASIECAFSFVRGCQQQRTLLSENIRTFLEKTPGKSIGCAESPIHTFIIPGVDETRSAASRIQQEGFDVRPILSPTVPAGKERLRICLHAFNTTEEITRLTRALATCTGVIQRLHA